MILFAACGLTVAIECAFLWACGIRSAADQGVVALANVVSNLALNLLMTYVLPWTWWWLALLEAAAVGFEYAVYARAFGGSWRLAWLTLAANALSFSIGVAVFWL